MQPYLALLFSHGRPAVYKFARWLISILNQIDAKYPDTIYILPESFVEIPFEIFRVLKRSHFPLYEIEEERKGPYLDEY